MIRTSILRHIRLVSFLSESTQLQLCKNRHRLARFYATYPPHIKVTLPALSPTMEKGNIAKWNKQEGDAVKEGDAMAEIETDKAVMSLESNEDGYLAKILLPAGTKDIPVGRLMCIMVTNAGDVPAFKGFKDDTVVPTKPAAAPEPAVVAVADPAPPTPTVEPLPVAKSPSPPERVSDTQRVYASPMAKRLAEAQQLRLEGKGSGIYDSIKSNDLSASSKTGTAPFTAKQRGPNKYKDIPVSNIRAVIAKRLLESKTTIPHFYVTMECQMENALRLRARVNKLYEKQKIRVSINDIIIKAISAACLKVPETNSHWMDKVVRQFEHVDVAVAVSTDTGLLTPIIFAADDKNIIEISQEMKSLAQKARQNKLKPEEFQGGTVCLSNMGMYGVSDFCAIINPPQTLILAIGGTTKKLISDKGAKGFKEIDVMNITASADHRVVDGAVCARWLQFFRDFMEDPGMMLM